MDSTQDATGTDRIRLSVVLPAYNESHRLPATLREIRPYLEVNFPRHEVIVVDDGSSDATAEITEREARAWRSLRLIRQPRNLGKGAAVRRGCLAARGDMVLFMDADHATPISEVEQMVSVLEREGHGAVVGCRTYQENESKWRRVMGLGLQLLAHAVVFRKAVVDSQCGFKLFARDTCQSVFARARVDGGMLDVEIFLLLQKLGLRCYYQPVHWNNKDGSRINILRCVVYDPIDLLEIRARDIAGVYDRPIAEQDQPWNHR